MSHPGATASDRHKVVIIGSGFGGLNAAQALKHADVDIKLIATDHAPPVPAAAVPGGDGHHLRGRDRPAHPADPAQAGERPGAARRRHPHRPDQPDRRLGAAGAHLPHAVRQPDHRRRRRPVLLRQRPFRRVGAGHEDDRRRAGAARPHPRRVRAGRAVQRPGAPQEAADVRRGRRRPDRRRDGRADRRNWPTRRSRAASGTSTRPRPRSSCWTPRPRCFRRWARSSASRPRRDWRRWASRSSSTPWSPTSTATASRSRTPTAPSGASSRPARCGRPVCRPARWAGSWPTSPTPKSTARAGSRCNPDLSIPGHPNVFVVGDMACRRRRARYGAGRDPGRQVRLGEPQERGSRREPTAPAQTARAVQYFDKGSMATVSQVQRGGQGRQAGVRRLLRLAGLAGSCTWSTWSASRPRSPPCCRGR